MKETYLTTEEVAKYIRLSTEQVRELARTGKITAYQPGRGYRFRKKDVDAYIESGKAIIENEE